MHAPYLHLALFGLLSASHTGTIVSARLFHPNADSNVESPPDDFVTIADAASASRIDDEPPRQLPSQADSLIAMQFSHDPHANRDHMEMIQNGELGLAAIRYSHTSFIANNGDDDAYVNVQGEFCVFDASLNKQDPATYPTIGSVMSKSEHCGEHRYMMPLNDVMQSVRDYDNSDNTKNEMRQLPLTGLVFHEGYSGAGLISNALSTFDSTLVLSEHPAIRDALAACDVIRNRYKSQNCSPSMQQRLVQDVIFLLSRTPNTPSPTKLYLKLPSTSSAYLPTMRSLYPHAKWIFVYRNANDALAKATQRKRSSTCHKAQRNPSTALSNKLLEEHHADLEHLTHHEVCALHLSSLLDVARREHEESGTGMLLSYDDDILARDSYHALIGFVDVILPYLGLEEEIHDSTLAKDRVSEVLSLRSNAGGRMDPQDKQWGGESIEISEEVGNASEMFLKHSMESIMRLR